MAFNKVEICGINTSRLPVLTSSEKEELLRKIQKGDAEAREAYIKGNLRLVFKRDQTFFRQRGTGGTTCSRSAVSA